MEYLFLILASQYEVENSSIDVTNGAKQPSESEDARKSMSPGNTDLDIQKFINFSH